MQCRRQSIQNRGQNLKVGVPKIFIDFSLKKHVVHNAITSINNSLMQAEIILIDVQAQNCFFRAFLQLFQIKYCLFQLGGLWECWKLLQWGSWAEPRKPKHF